MNPYSTQFIEDDDIQAVINALQGHSLTQGNLTHEFEQKIADFIGVKYALAFNSATSALYASYKAINLDENHRAITSPISFVATANMMLECDSKPIFCDVKANGNIDEKSIKSYISNETKAVVSVDYGGNSVEADEIQKICKENNLVFISDSSHAFGSRYKNQKVGTLADITIFSFHAIKPITTAEGGMLVTNDSQIYEKAKLIRSHGMIKKELWNCDVKSSGFNFRMTELQAALGMSQLNKIDRFLNIREEIAKFYDKAFEGNPYFFTLHQHIKYFSTNHLYPIILAPEFWCSKEDIFKSLQKEGLGVQVHYKPINEFSLYKDILGETNLYNARDFYRAEISIPCHQKMNLEDARVSAEKILSVFEKFKVPSH
ncbi:UDP-4-amino-4,6-dideoxy-N-acetyl-beta-L-altrosamine transaminase [Helicobacter cappadocius]|uniref:UDP-4-amino-4,6-dideoxy-N-acetyl-beta-L-altrosamine transaminase n=1 Tax=Helicobacter cappadocius TaxID=3063998 RepID=A0AA90PTB7_9HELI|nr:MULTISPECIES: UDP-4-amino-4,6-dideoxy-N-acetyl-beta-L-altrosamine transaminase [unclassified Helicobacter]MDO7253220.1 UDP-4-amino-4,6-dideoxy-N-acetyl-beta-L-altrosamine transaminase [Helicobacter sp. faydin-H75]MDP2539144.1 UDP-4-amino-4,6-dideoxy-N-acetyl-beta-L-altrosamine transaminase [Helicobacter sp. faydin-H76]